MSDEAAYRAVPLFSEGQLTNDVQVDSNSNIEATNSLVKKQVGNISFHINTLCSVQVNESRKGAREKTYRLTFFQACSFHTAKRHPCPYHLARAK